MLVGFAASSSREGRDSFTLRQAPRTLYKPVGNNLFMNKAIIILLVLIGIKCHSQNFEGIITYKVKYTNPNSKLIPDSIFYAESDITYIEKRYYKGNKYKFIAEINGKREIELYDPNKNRLYTYSENDDFASWTDTTKSLDKIVDVVELDDTEIEILGLNCRIVGFQIGGGQLLFAYSNKLYLNAELYKNHKYDCWSEFLSMTNSVPLAIKISTPWNKRSMKAIEIEKIEISEVEFEVPNFKTLIESVN
jgi:hypothetical protein